LAPDVGARANLRAAAPGRRQMMPRVAQEFIDERRIERRVASLENPDVHRHVASWMVRRGGAPSVAVSAAAVTPGAHPLHAVVGGAERFDDPRNAPW
jgi:hypothetical protein